MVNHLNAWHAQFNRKSDNFGLQIGSFQGCSFPDRCSRGTKTWVRVCRSKWRTDAQRDSIPASRPIRKNLWSLHSFFAWGPDIINENAKCKRIELKQTTCLRLRFRRNFYKNFGRKNKCTVLALYSYRFPICRGRQIVAWKLAFKRKIVLVITEQKTLIELNQAIGVRLRSVIDNRTNRINLNKIERHRFQSDSMLFDFRPLSSDKISLRVR